MWLDGVSHPYLWVILNCGGDIMRQVRRAKDAKGTAVQAWRLACAKHGVECSEDFAAEVSVLFVPANRRTPRRA